MPRVTPTTPVGPAALVALLVAATPRPAAASYPCSTYVVASKVELLPNDAAATQVIIHGAFLQLTSATSATYSDPRCGVMYFSCVSGEEEMCRMQWKELRDRTSATSQLCEGFGSWNEISTATLRDEGAALGAPDPWDLGMGISEGAYLDNKCPPALRLACPLSDVDGGTVVDAAPDADAAPTIDAAPPTDAGPPADSARPPEDAAPEVVDAATDHAVGTDAGADAHPAPPPRTGGGCAIAPAPPRSPGLAAIVLACLVRRGRRRRRARK